MTAISLAAAQVESWKDRSGHVASFVTVSAGLDLEVLLESLYPNAGTFTVAARQLAERQVREARIWWQRSIDQYQAETPDARTIVLASGGHHVFLTNQSEVTRLILSFAEGLSP